MSKVYRIRTTTGQENNEYLKVPIDLTQNYDHLEILSLKISQKDDYQNFCSDYGVVAGRVIVNSGFGVPNVKVSIFVPVQDSDLEDPVKSAIYPYTEPFPDQKNRNGIRYNVLPKNQQTLDHTPVGTFPKKREILDDTTTLEIYEKYYKYTTTTNAAGDYILFGVPVGDHFLHYDMDISDIGFISVRPFELIEKDGYSEDLFKNRFKYKGSNNLDKLPQIFSENIPIRVEPYWCDSLSVGSALGINRVDIEPNIEITPTAIFMGSIFTDDEKDSLNKNCKPAREMGKLNEVITGSGSIEAIRRTVDGNIETFSFSDNSIDDNGNWSVLVPMNIRKVVTDEFGNLVPSPDGIKGIATEGDYRFRISMDATSTDKKLRERAKYLVPNTNNNFNFGEYSQKDLKNSQIFTINEQLSDITDSTPYQDDITNQYNYLEEFFPFRWKKVYTVKQYIGRIQKTPDVYFNEKWYYGDEARGFIGIKDIINAEGVNKFPTNRTDTNIHPLYTIICILVVLFGHIVGFINGIIQIINGLITAICNLKLPVGICGYSLKGGQFRFPFVAELNQSTSQPYYSINILITGNNTLKSQKCYDAKGICDDVENLSACGGDLRDCYEDAYFGTDVPSNHQESEFFDPYISSFCSAQSNNTGSWSNPHYPNLPGIPLPSREIRTHISTHAFGGSNPAGCCMYYDGTFCYSGPNCYPDSGPLPGCQRVRFTDPNIESFNAAIDLCTKCELPSPNPNCNPPENPEKANGCCEGELKLLGSCWSLKNKCIFGGLLCKKCKDACNGPNFSCCSCGDYECPDGCNDATCGSGEGCCQGKCCAKIGLIPLKCADEGIDYRISLIRSPFSNSCNSTYVKPFSCENCGGKQTPGIKDWASCVLEPVAVFLRMLKFDFYNDWVGGTLYFPLIKRKYKLKNSKRKFGQIKKDKFCDFECKERTGFSDDNPLGVPLPVFSNNFQGNPTYNQWRIKIPTLVFSNPTITVNGCIAKIKGKRVTNWYGTEENDGQTYNLDLAVKELEFKGNNINGEGCIITFDTYSDFTNTFNLYGIDWDEKNRELQAEHGKPEYVEVEGPNGTSSWENIGGHGHHRNICDDTRMMERMEYFKTSLDCNEGNQGYCEDNPDKCSDEDNPLSGFGGGDDDDDEDDEEVEVCRVYSCLPDCGTNGVAPCVEDTVEEYRVYSRIVKHGLISWNDNQIYYTPYIPNDDVKYNQIEYKANLMLPTTIMELGSSVYCDIDDIPFIMDVLPPTTFNASYEEIKYRFGDTNNNYNNGIKKTVTKFDDKKDISLNLRAYVEFACSKVICENILAPVVQSQIGVEMIDVNDIGIEIGNCFVRFDHDDQVRDYFCRRFNGYKASDLSFHHQRPGSIQFENEYNTYPEITLVDGVDIYYEFEETGDVILSEYNDNDSFIPGDGCGYRSTNGPTDYFYGVAPGQTSGFINYPNSDTSFDDDGTIDFGQTAQPNATDVILQSDLTDEINNGNEDIKGIRFNRSQTPYYLYFGLVPGKTSLHKTVSKFFADRINKVTLLGIGGSNSAVSENTNNSPNITNPVENNFTVYKTCLGETLIEKVKP